jgi:hypothetical protein
VTRALVAKLGAALGGAGVVAGGVLYVVLGGGGAGPSAAPRSWIDDPLHGSHAAPGAVAVLAHAADPDGIALVELAVNGAVVATQPVAPAAPFASATMTWTATGPGAALLRVRARDAAGEWGAPAHATIYVDGSSPTSPPTATAPPTAPPPSTGPPAPPPPTTTRRPPTRPPSTTRPPSPTACTSLVAPGLVSPAHNAVVGSRTPTLRWSYGGRCRPSGFTIQVSTERDFSRVTRTGSTGGATLNWSVTPALTDCQTYYWRVRATATGGTAGAWSTTFGFVVREGRCP